VDLSKSYRNLPYEESLTLLVTFHLRTFVLLSTVKCVYYTWHDPSSCISIGKLDEDVTNPRVAAMAGLPEECS